MNPLLLRAVAVVVPTLFMTLFTASGAVSRVVVDAGKFARAETVIAVPLDRTNGTFVLESQVGRSPVQIEPDGRAWCVVRDLGRGEKRTYRVVTNAIAPGADGVTAERTGDVLKLAVAGRPAFHYQGGPGRLPRTDLAPIFRRGGYLHPVFTPAGAVVTDDYPPNHKHHHGIWFPWTKTEFEGRQPDFWNMGDGTGRVEFDGLDAVWNGSVSGGFRARHRFVDSTAPTPKTALNEVWEVRLWAVGRGAQPYFLFDLVSTQTCAAASPLKLPEYRYGGLGVRGNWAWNGATNVTFLTSEGETDRLKGNAARARWCHLGGLIDGRLAGIAILGHPDNFRAPQPMRQHPTEPFFNFAPSQLGDFAIEPGQPYVSRYRFVVSDGVPDAVLLDRLWNDFAQPPSVTVE